MHALDDALRALRGRGAAQRGSANDVDRGAMFDLAALVDRLRGFAEDQGEDDWGEFWVTTADVATLEQHVAFLAEVRGLASATVPALQVLHRDLTAIAQPPEPM